MRAYFGVYRRWQELPNLEDNGLAYFGCVQPKFVGNPGQHARDMITPTAVGPGVEEERTPARPDRIIIVRSMSCARWITSKHTAALPVITRESPPAAVVSAA